MPNICIATVIVKGNINNVDEFTKIIQADYNYNTMEFTHKPHFFRVFEAPIIDEEIDGLIKTTTYSIECAWSIYACMESGPFSYYDECKAEFDEFYGTNLQICARKLNLFIEIFSEEPGIGFNEYIMYDNLGVRFKNDCLDMHIYDLNKYKSREDFMNQTKDYISKEDYKDSLEYDEGYYACDAIEYEPFINKMEYAINPIVIKVIK